jgi:maleate isomerase
VAADLGKRRAVAIGLILLATDRVSGSDVQRFLPAGDDVELFPTRVPLDVVATPATLAAMADHLAAATAVLVPGGPLNAIGFSCTSGSVAIGPDTVAARIGSVRPGVPTTNPVDAAALGLQALGVRRIALLTPYHDGPSALIERSLAAAGIDAVVKASFDLDGDPEMNRVTASSILEQGARLAAHPDAEALFVSCTGLRTRAVIGPLEQRTGKPTVTSNQAHAWALLRLAGAPSRLPDRGRLFLL